MLTPIGNKLNHKVPAPGKIGILVSGYERWTNKPHFMGMPVRKCITESYPLTDRAFNMPGIHTVTVRFLDNGETKTVSGFYFEEIE